MFRLRPSSAGNRRSSSGVHLHPATGAPAMARSRLPVLLIGGLAAAILVWLARSRNREGWLRQPPGDRPTTLVFELGGHVGQPEIRRMAERVLAAFERFDTVDMLILLPGFTGFTPAAALDLEGLRAGLMSWGKVRRYAVVAPPVWAGALINLADGIIPVEARTFPIEALDEARAWASEGRATAA
uniref:STAS/SEC14 domain-containing protein n=2 Tax=Cereibacter TaxID=1653176 RepID=A4WXV3_CERS5